MKKIGFFLAILLFQIALVYGQQNNTRQRMSFKSIVIQNGDTIITEKNFDSDDPNANLTDSIPFENGTFQFSFGNINPNDFFGNSNPFGLDQYFQSPFFNDSLMLHFFKDKSFIIDTSFHREFIPNTTPSTSDNLVPYTAKEPNYNMSDFNVAITPEDNIMNITFRQSTTDITEISITNSAGKGLYSEQFEKSDGYYVRQIELNKLGKGKFTILLKQGINEQKKTVIIE